MAEETPLANTSRAEARADGVGGAASRPSRRMFLWLVGLPAVLLALAWAGTHWRELHRFSHRVYYKRRLRSSSDPAARTGAAFQLVHHLHVGMDRKAAGELFAPLKLTDALAPELPEGEFWLDVIAPEGVIKLVFKEGRLTLWESIAPRNVSGKRRVVKVRR